MCIDNTNPTSEVRSLYIKGIVFFFFKIFYHFTEAQKRGISCRCFVFTTSLKLAQHLNVFRQKMTNGNTGKIPEIGKELDHVTEAIFSIQYVSK